MIACSLRSLAAVLAFFFTVIPARAEEPTEQLLPFVFHAPVAPQKMECPDATKVQNAEESSRLAELGLASMELETPAGYYDAVEQYLKPAVAKDQKNLRARALLVSAYLRNFERVSWDENSAAALNCLLQDDDKIRQAPVEMVVAVAEALIFFHRIYEAADLLQEVAQKRASPELLHQWARVAMEQHDLKLAASLAEKWESLAKAGTVNPRHAMLGIRIAGEQKEEKVALHRAERLNKEFPEYVPGLLAHATMLLKEKDYRAVKEELAFLDARHLPLNREEQDEANLLAGEALIGMKEPRNALAFAEAGFDSRFLELKIRARARLPEWKEAYSELLEAEQEKNQEKSLEHLVKAAEVNRADPIPFVLLGGAFERLGDQRSAMDRYRVAVRSPENPALPVLELLRLHLARYEIAEAAELIKLARERGAPLYQIENFQGVLSWEQKDSKGAMEHFQKVVDAGVRTPEAATRLADYAAEMNLDDTAIGYYGMALRQVPSHPKAMLGVALRLLHKSGPAPAVSYLNYELAAAPHSAAILTNLSLVYLRSGDQVAGKNHLQNAIRENPNYAEAFRLLGDLTREEGNRQVDYTAKRHSYRYALASYEMFSKLSPNDPESYKATADLYFDIRDLSAAAQNYHKLLQLVPNYPEARLRLAQISRNGGDATLATQLLQEEVSLHPENDSAYVEMGNINMAIRDFSAANRYFREALRANKNNPDAYFGLAVIEHLAGNYKEAREFLEKTSFLDPRKADVYWQLGLLESKTKHKKAAIEAFEKYAALVTEPAAKGKAEEKIKSLGGHWRDPASAAPGASEEHPTLFASLKEAIWAHIKKGGEMGENSVHINLGTSKETGFASTFAFMRLPAGWKCGLEQKTWICQPSDPQFAPLANVTFSSREQVVGMDYLPVYKEYLGKSWEYLSLSGETIHPEVKFTRDMELAGHPWVESLQMQSEKPDFITHYFAIIQSGRGVLVSVNVRKDKYADFLPELEKSIASLRSIPAKEGPDFGGMFGLPNFAVRLRQLPADQIVVEKIPKVSEARAAELRDLYAALLAAWKEKNFALMLEQSARILSDRQDFNDALSYQALALKGLEAEKSVVREKAALQAAKERVQWLKENEKKAERAFEKKEDEPAAAEELAKLIPEIYLKDPESRKPASWR